MKLRISQATPWVLAPAGAILVALSLFRDAHSWHGSWVPRAFLAAGVALLMIAGLVRAGNKHAAVAAQAEARYTAKRGLENK